MHWQNFMLISLRTKKKLVWPRTCGWNRSHNVLRSVINVVTSNFGSVGYQSRKGQTKAYLISTNARLPVIIKHIFPHDLIHTINAISSSFTWASHFMWRLVCFTLKFDCIDPDEAWTIKRTWSPDTMTVLFWMQNNPAIWDWLLYSQWHPRVHDDDAQALW